jgi:DNA-binding GntR family transcriptional regulator
LQQEGYVVRVEDRRPKLAVAPLTSEDASELFGILGEIEGLVGEYAARLPTNPRRALVEELRRTNDAIAERFQAGDREPDAYYRLDNRFHRLPVEACGRPRLLALHTSIQPQADRYRRLYVSRLDDEITMSLDEHEAVVRAIAAALPENAGNAVRANWKNGARRLSVMIESLGERGDW